MCRGGQYVLRHLPLLSHVRRGFVGTLYCKQGLGNSSPPTACLVLRIPFSYICLFYMVLHFGIRSRIYYIYLTNNCLSTRYEVSTSHNVVTNSHARSWLAVIVRKKMQISWDDIFRLYQMVHALTIKTLPICILALMIKP